MNKFSVLGMLATGLALGLVLLFVSCQTTSGTLSSLLRTGTSEIQRWDEGNENERDVTVYSFNPKIKDELIQAVEDDGFLQTWSGEYTRDWDLTRGVLRWCVPSNAEKWDHEIQFSAIGETAVHTYGFKLIPNSDGISRTIKITGYNSEVVTSFRQIQIWSLDQELDEGPPVAARWGKDFKNDGQTIICKLLAEWEGNLKYWTGTGKCYIWFQCYPPKDPSYNQSDYVYSEDGENPTPVDIKDAVTTLEWSKFIWVRDGNAG
jgi:hypothetical protein